LWDYNNPELSEKRFLGAIEDAEPATPRYIELLTQLARSQGLQGKFDAAHGALNYAQSMLHPDMIAPRLRLMLERGRLYNSAGDPGSACDFFSDAFALARSNMDEPRIESLAVDAAHMLGIAAPEDRRLTWNETALEICEASPHPESQRWRGTLYNNIGWTYHDQGQYAQALSLFQRGLEWRSARRSGPKDDAEIRIARWSVARTLRSLGEFEQALAMQEALERDCAAAGEPDGYVFEELGENLQALGRADDARAQFGRAHALLSADAWMREHEAPRLARLASLSRG
jgi:tetratricopeptide (TPR) repeat protein